MKPALISAQDYCGMMLPFDFEMDQNPSYTCYKQIQTINITNALMFTSVEMPLLFSDTCDTQQITKIQ